MPLSLRSNATHRRDDSGGPENHHGRVVLARMLFPAEDESPTILWRPSHRLPAIHCEPPYHSPLSNAAIVPYLQLFPAEGGWGKIWTEGFTSLVHFGLSQNAQQWRTYNAWHVYMINEMVVTNLPSLKRHTHSSFFPASVLIYATGTQCYFGGLVRRVTTKGDGVYPTPVCYPHHLKTQSTQFRTNPMHSSLFPIFLLTTVVQNEDTIKIISYTLVVHQTSINILKNYHQEFWREDRQSPAKLAVVCDEAVRSMPLVCVAIAADTICPIGITFYPLKVRPDVPNKAGYLDHSRQLIQIWLIAPSLDCCH